MRKRQGKTLRNNLTHVDYICCNIYCKKLLTDYELGRQNRSYKYRFCIKCRMVLHDSYIAWYCLGCNKIMTESIGGVTGRYYCTKQGFICEGEKLIKKKHQARWYKINKLAKSIVSQGGLQNFKCPSKI